MPPCRLSTRRRFGHARDEFGMGLIFSLLLIPLSKWEVASIDTARGRSLWADFMERQWYASWKTNKEGPARLSGGTTAAAADALGLKIKRAEVPRK